MSEIDNGIKQPLRFYDSVTKQNWRREWVLSGLSERATLINPQNTILPFQIRRRRSPLAITTFDLYKYDDVVGGFVYDSDVLSIIPAPATNHFYIVQMETFDNIIWYPLQEFATNFDCGYYYLYLSDTVNDFYSEVFRVNNFDVSVVNYISILSDHTVTGTYHLTKDGTNAIISANKLF